MRPSFFILAILLVLTSCKKSINQAGNVRSAAYFPNAIGNFWKYKVVDSTSNKSVLVDVNIVGNTILPGGQTAKIWTFTYPDHLDTSFAYQIADTFRFVDKDLSVTNAYVIPLQLNTQWRTNPYYVFDSIQVTDNRTYNLNDTNFDNSFLLHRFGYLPNAKWNSIEWFCPKIGMVTKVEKKSFLIANTVFVFYWELIEFNLK